MPDLDADVDAQLRRERGSQQETAIRCLVLRGNGKGRLEPEHCRLKRSAFTFKIEPFNGLEQEKQGGTHRVIDAWLSAVSSRPASYENVFEHPQSCERISPSISTVLPTRGSKVRRCLQTGQL